MWQLFSFYLSATFLSLTIYIDPRIIDKEIKQLTSIALISILLGY